MLPRSSSGVKIALSSGCAASSSLSCATSIRVGLSRQRIALAWLCPSGSRRCNVRNTAEHTSQKAPAQRRASRPALTRRFKRAQIIIESQPLLLKARRIILGKEPIAAAAKGSLQSSRLCQVALQEELQLPNAQLTSLSQCLQPKRMRSRANRQRTIGQLEQSQKLQGVHIHKVGT